MHTAASGTSSSAHPASAWILGTAWPLPSHDVAFATGLLTVGPALQIHVSGGPRLRSPRTSGSSRTRQAARRSAGLRSWRPLSGGFTVQRIAKIADVTEADVEEWLARYGDYEASFTGYPD